MNLRFSSAVLLVLASTLHARRVEACNRPPSVSITSVSPSGTLTPGTELSIFGSSFNTLSSGARVDFEGRDGNQLFQATVSFRRISDSELRAYVPSDSGSGVVRVTEGVTCSGPIAGSNVGVVYTLAIGPSLTIDNRLPRAPFGRSGVATSNTEIALEWMGGDPADRDGFVVNLSEDWGRTYKTVATIQDPRAESTMISGLTSGTTYVIDLAAFGPGGETFSQPEELLVVTTFGPAPGRGNVTINNSIGALCNANRIQLSNVESFFDDNQNGVVDGVQGEHARGSYPHTMEFRQNANLLLPPERFVFNSASYGRNLAGQLTGNLVVAGYFTNCGERRFVALHVAVFKQNNVVHVQGVSILAGDRVTFIGGQESRGAILENTLPDAQLDARELENGRAVGSVSSNLTFSDLGTNQLFTASVTFAFDVPIELR